jgi:hypothetical protein
MTTTSHRVTVIAAIAACWLGGCANSMTDVLSTARLPTFDMQLRPLSQEAPPPPTLTRIQITQADLVAADGACAPATAESATGQTTGVALGMPECGLVQVLGQPEQLNISADESGRRIVVMRYNKGERAGLYQFSDGQLKVIERVAEPAPPPKPKKPAPAPKPRRVT